LFGAPSPAKPGGLFGAAPAPSTGGLFGQSPAPSTSGLFGQPPAPAPITGGLFGSAPPASAVPVAPPPSADALLAQQLAAVENQKKQLELLEAWRGNPPSGSKVVPTSQYYADSGNSWTGGGSSYAASSPPLHSYRAAARSTAKIRPRGYTPTKESPATMLGMKSGSPILSPNKFVGSTTKTLFIKPSSLTPKPKNRLLLPSDLFKTSPAPVLENGIYEDNRTPTNGSASNLRTSSSPHQQSQTRNSPLSPAHDFYRQVVDSSINPSPSSMLQLGNQFVPKLSKPGYVVYPSISDLESMSEADLAAVSGFKVERPNYGSVAWDGAVDVRGVDIDSVVIIESKNVSVYDEAESKGEKPQRGSKLNRPAVITMYDVFPKDGPRSSEEAKDKMLRKIEKSTKKMGAELLSYDAENGVWTFRVGHFSRYGLDDDSDDDSDIDAIAPSTLETSDDEPETTSSFVKAKDLGGASRMHAPMDEDECTSANTDNISYVETFVPSETEDVEFHEITEIVRAGEEAYAMMTEEVLAEYEEDEFVVEPPVEEEHLPFPVEGEVGHIFPAAHSLRAAVTLPSTGISRRLAGKIGLSTTSSIDFGMRMRQSFRVGKKPYSQ
jgi:nuclear pore complex protein Nup98-Nup96